MWIDLALQDLVFLVLFLFLILDPLLHQPVDICGEQVDVMSDLSQFIIPLDVGILAEIPHGDGGQLLFQECDWLGHAAGEQSHEQQSNDCHEQQDDKQDREKTVDSVSDVRSFYGGLSQHPSASRGVDTYSPGRTPSLISCTMVSLPTTSA